MLHTNRYPMISDAVMSAFAARTSATRRRGAGHRHTFRMTVGSRISGSQHSGPHRTQPKTAAPQSERRGLSGGLHAFSFEADTAALSDGSLDAIRPSKELLIDGARDMPRRALDHLAPHSYSWADYRLMAIRRQPG